MLKPLPSGIKETLDEIILKLEMKLKDGSDIIVIERLQWSYEKMLKHWFVGHYDIADELTKYRDLMRRYE